MSAYGSAFPVVGSRTSNCSIGNDRATDSNIGSNILKVRGASVAAALEGKDTGAARASFDVDFMRKDLRDMLEEAKALGIALPAAASTLKCFDEASSAAFGEIDGTQYPAWWVSHTETAQA